MPTGQKFAARGGVIKYDAIMAQTGTAAPTEVGESPTNDITDMLWTRTGVGVYTASIPAYSGSLENERTVVTVTSGNAVCKPLSAAIVGGDIVVYTYNAAGTAADIVGQFYVSVRYWPK